MRWGNFAEDQPKDLNLRRTEYGYTDGRKLNESTHGSRSRSRSRTPNGVFPVARRIPEDPRENSLAKT